VLRNRHQTSAPREDQSLETRSLRLERVSPTHSIGLCLFALIVSGFGITPIVADSPDPASVPTEVSTAITAAITDLSSPDFAVRQHAEKRLLALGPPVFAPLIASLESVPIEAGNHILLVLEQLWLQTPEPQSDSLERQLETLRLSFGAYQPAVARLLFANHRLREDRAARALRRLNAIVETTDDLNVMELQAIFRQPAAIPSQRISQIILPRSWKGTDADLWHIQRLAHLKFLQVFVVRGNGISESSKQEMQVGFSDIHVEDRAEVFIGVIGEPIAFDNRLGCHVRGVQADCPAQTAGIQPGDLIKNVDGLDIFSFKDLVNALKSKRGYQPIELIVERIPGEPPLTVTVIGLPWEARRFPSPPPPPQMEPLYSTPLFPTQPTLPSTN